MTELLDAPPAPPEGFTLEAPPEPPTGFRLESGPSRYPVNTDEQQATIDKARDDEAWKQATKDPKTYANSVVVPELNKSETFKALHPDEQQKIFLQHIQQQFPKLWEPSQNAALESQIPSGDQYATDTTGVDFRRGKLASFATQVFQGLHDVKDELTGNAPRQEVNINPNNPGSNLAGHVVGTTAPMLAATAVSGPVGGAVAMGAQGAGGAIGEGKQQGYTGEQTAAIALERGIFNAMLGLVPGGAVEASAGRTAAGIAKEVGKTVLKVQGINVTQAAVESQVKQALGLQDDTYQRVLQAAASGEGWAQALLFGAIHGVVTKMAPRPSTPEEIAAAKFVTAKESALGERDTAQGQQIVQGIENTRGEVVDQSLRQAQGRAAEQPTSTTGGYAEDQPTPPPGFTLETSTPERAASTVEPPVPAKITTEGDKSLIDKETPHEAQIPVRETQGQVPQAQAPGVDELPTPRTDAGKEVLTDQSGGVTEKKPAEAEAPKSERIALKTELESRRVKFSPDATTAELRDALAKDKKANISVQDEARQEASKNADTVANAPDKATMRDLGRASNWFSGLHEHYLRQQSRGETVHPDLVDSVKREYDALDFRLKSLWKDMERVGLSRDETRDWTQEEVKNVINARTKRMGKPAPESGLSGASTKQTASGGVAEVSKAAEGTQGQAKSTAQEIHEQATRQAEASRDIQKRKGNEISVGQEGSFESLLASHRMDFANRVAKGEDPIKAREAVGKSLEDAVVAKSKNLEWQVKRAKEFGQDKLWSDYYKVRDSAKSESKLENKSEAKPTREISQLTANMDAKLGKERTAYKKGQVARELIEDERPDVQKAMLKHLADSDPEAMAALRKNPGLRILNSSFESMKPTQAVGAAHPDSPEFSDTAAEQDTERTGIRRSEVDDLRQQLNLPEMPDSEKRSWAEALAKDPHRTSSAILNELRAKPNTLLNDSDWLKLGQHITDIKARADAANKAIGEAYAKGDTAAEDAAREAFNAAVKEMDDFTNTIRDHGKGGAKAESGRALAAQAAIFKMDTSLDKMLYDRQVAKGESLTEAEAEEVRKEHNAIQKAREAADIEDAENHGKAAQAAAEFHLEQLKAKAREDDTPAPVKKLANRIKDYLNTTQDAALARIRARGTKVGANDISNLVDETIVGSIEITKGLINVGEWSARMVELLGDSIKPHLTKLFDAAKAHAAKHEEKIFRKFAGLESDKVKAAVKAKPADMLGKIQERQKGGSGLDELAPYIKALALEKVRGGVSELPPLLDALHADLNPIFPEATKEQIRDAMSGFGKSTSPDPEAAKVTLRDLNQQSIKLAQLEWLKEQEAKGKKDAPPATGPRRDPPSTKVQALTKEVNAKKRELGVVVTDPERQLKSTLDSMKTRVRNRRDLLQTEIDTGQRIVQGVPKKISDAELESLRTELDAVKKVHEDIFGKKGMSDEQKLKLATSAAEANQKMWQDRLDKARSGVFDKAGKTAKLSSPEIEAIRKQTDAAKAEFKELKDAANPPKSTSQKQEEALLKSIKEVNDKLQTGDVAPTPPSTKNTTVDTARIAELKTQLADLNQQVKTLRDGPKTTASQRQAEAIGKRITAIENRLRTGDTSSLTNPRPTVDTAEVFAAKHALAEASKKLAELRKSDPMRQAPAIEKRITELQEKIASGDIAPKQNSSTVDNAYTTSLKAQRDSLNEKLAELRKADPVLKAKAEVDAAERAAEEYDRKLQAGEFTKGQPAPKSNDAAAMAARTRLEQARDAYNKARDADPAYIAGKEKSSDAAYVRSLTRRAADLADREARGDFAPRTPNPKVRGPDAVAAKAAYEAKRQAWELKKMQWELDRRAPWEKGLDNTAKVVRASVLSGPITLLKLVNASIQQVTFKPLSELAGTIIRETPGFRDLAKKASLEGGGFDPKAYGASIKSMLTQGLKDAHQTLRDPTHKSELDLLYGKKGLPQSSLEVFGILHGAEKAPLKRFAFEYAKSKIQRAALARGENIADPVVNDRIGREAYADAERTIFQEENRLTDATNAFISRLEAKNKDGTTNALGKVGATAARVALPVTKVGTNIVAQTFEHVAGLEWGLTKLAWNARALDKLTPGQANIIMRNLKRGSVGTAAAAIGWFAPAIVASIPKILMHNPLLQAMQWGANAATAANSPTSAKDQEKKGIIKGALHATTETVRETPLFREMGDEAALLNPTQQDASLGRTIGGLVVPQASSQIARLTDDAQGVGDVLKRSVGFGSTPPDRKAKGTWENIKLGIPGLRQTVPEAQKAKTTELVSSLRKNPSDPVAQGELRKLTKGEQDAIRERYIQASDEIATFHNGPHEAALAKLEQMPPEKRNAREVRSGIGMTSYIADLRARLQTEMLKAKTPADSAKLRELLGRLNKLK